VNWKRVAIAGALLLPFAAARAQTYPNMVPSTSQITFANPDGTPLFPGQAGQAQVTFTIQNGPITFKTRDVFCITNPGGKEYMAECDDVTMDAGCTGTWQTGDQCTITYSFLADGDDNRCNVTGTSPAYPDGCEGTVQVKSAELAQHRPDQLFGGNLRSQSADEGGAFEARIPGHAGGH
jgi:hypothetical protein